MKSIASSALRTSLEMTVVLALLSTMLSAQLAWREVPELSWRQGHAMAYDPLRKRVVMFGGTMKGLGVYTEMLNDTWEWGGSRWEPRLGLSKLPAARFGHAMAWDPVRKRILLFGGADPNARRLFSDTWEWDGRTWKQLTPKTTPPKRFWFDMTTDPRRQRIVLFGGGSSFQLWPWGLTADTWEWDGSDWIKRSPANKPTPRAQHRMAYHNGSKQIVLYGGLSPGVVPQDVWEWDGTNWRQRMVRPAPYLRYSMFALCNDPQSGNLLFHGGENLFWARQGNETWEWNGKSWRELKPKTKPAARYFPRLVADDARKEVLLFGGLPKARPDRPNDTWIWKGADWQMKEAWPMPDNTLSHSIAHDAARDQFVFLEARSDPVLGLLPLKTWVLEEERWRPVPAARVPPFRTMGTLVYHPGLRKVLLYGGTAPDRWRTTLNDTWLWDAKTWTEHKGKPGPKSLAQMHTRQIVYESHRNKILFFTFQRETWQWENSTGWTQLYPKKSPSYPSGSLAYDAGRKKTVFFASWNKQRDPYNVWEWDGSDWTEIVPKTRPQGTWTKMEYFPALGGVVLFGGWDNRSQPIPETWLWDGKDWRKLGIGGTPWSALSSAYDANRQRLRAFYGTLGFKPASSIWELSIKSLKATERYPRLGEKFSAEVTLPGQAAQPFLLALSLGHRPGIPLRQVSGVGTEMLPLAPDALFWASLQLGMVTVLDAQGKGRLPLAIPNNKSLLWLNFNAAGLTLSPNLSVGAITNRLPLQIVK